MAETRISQATADDVPALARLQWWDTLGEPAAADDVDSFVADFSEWCAVQWESHFAFVARTDRGEIVGKAWCAMIPRVPRPGQMGRYSADIQSVFVVPEHRGRGLGSALVAAATDHALGRGAARVVVHSSRRAVQVYERLGFVSSHRLLQLPPDE